MSEASHAPEASRIHAVVVVHDRYLRLQAAVDSMARQSLPPERIWIVDNTPAARRRTIEGPASIGWIRSERNLGGAGGYAVGIASALAGGATHVLLIDDDGVLADDDYLATALAEAERGELDVLAPLAVDETDPTRLCFPCQTSRGRSYLVADAEGKGLSFGPAHLFNGAFVPAATFIRYGLPDLRLYLRGDEVDFLYRVLGGGGRVATSPKLRVTHPSGVPEAKEIFGGRLMAIDPGEGVKRELTFRNRGHIFRTHRMHLRLVLDAARYALYFLIVRRGDVAGYGEWLRLTWRGWRGRLGPPGGS